MKFTYHKKRITLKGVRPELTKCSAIGAHKLKKAYLEGKQSLIAFSCCTQSTLQTYLVLMLHYVSGCQYYP